MNIILITVAVTILLSGGGVPEKHQQYALEKPNGPWCLYQDKARWSRDIENLGARSVASIAFDRLILNEIDYTIGAESGDWIVYDKYKFDKDGKVIELRRLINSASSDVAENRVYTRVRGGLQLRSKRARRLSSGERAPPRYEVPELPVIIDRRNLPFARFTTTVGSTETCGPEPTK